MTPPYPLPLKAAILAIGDELLSGHTQDTNTRWLARRLHDLGLRLVEARIVPDEAARIQGSVWELQERREADLVVTCGGLGPTHDDRTVAALAALHGVPLVRHGPTWEWLRARHKEYFDAGNRTTPEPSAATLKMALVPRFAEVFENPVGAAPALLLRRRMTTREGDAFTVVLPGVPQELQTLWGNHIRPRLESLAGGRTARRTVHTLLYRGYESEAAKDIAETEARHPEVAVGSYPHWGRKEVHLRVSGTDPDTVLAAAEDLRERLVAAGHTVEEVETDPPESPNP